ncbi:MAG: aspartyl/asparaginyl beta-hydroxylase domain-containing protein [Rhodobacteraceae bacterium]|nr:aspartyl/asparaginyl beta-hydroxylase domain-containing protein [Paracoccaceae bacterium]
MLEQFVMGRIRKRLRKLYADIDTPPVLDMETYFPQAEALQALYPALRDEALALYAGAEGIPRFHEISATQQRISASDGKAWRMVMVQSYGHRVAANAARTPVLAGFLDANPEVSTAAYSFLDPGKHIPAHRGPFRGILRYHLCLFAPDWGSAQGPWLSVDGSRIPYAEGGALLWDDTFLHEVLNPSAHPRIALLLDVRRPVTRLAQKLAYRGMMRGGGLYSALTERRMRIG